MIKQRINQLSDSIIKLRERKEIVDAELADLKEYIGTEKETDAVMERIRTLWADGRIFKEVHRERTGQLNGLVDELGRDHVLEKVRKQLKWEICKPKGLQLNHHNGGHVFFVQQEGDNKLYVLKIPRSIIYVESFRNEVKTVLAMNHPNILKVVDYSLGEYPYMVSPYYEGGTMAEADFDNWTDAEKETYRAIMKNASDYVKAKGYRMQDRGDHNTFLMADKRTPIIGDLEHWHRR